MPLSQPQHFTELKRLISSWCSAYQYASLSSLAVKTAKGPVLIFGRIILEFSKPEGNHPFRLETEDLVAQRDDIKISNDALENIVAEASQGKMPCGDEHVSLKSQGEYLSSSFFPIYHPLINTGPRLPAVAIGGIRRDALLNREGFRPSEHFDWALKSADQPFDTLDELLIFIGLPRLLQIPEMTTLELVARAPVTIKDTSRVENNEALITCQLAGGLNPSLVKIGYKVASKGLPLRSFVTGDRLSWKNEASFHYGTARVSLMDVPVLQAFVSYAGIATHQWWVTDPKKSFNVRKAAYEPYDENLDVIKRFLAASGNNKSEDFETGIALLLYLLGFSVAHMGTTKLLSEGPDMLASTPSGNLLVVECTIGLLNEGNKLAKLTRRTISIKEKLMAAGHSHSIVQPIITTALMRSSVTTELEDAGKAEIAVVCKEELDSLLSDSTIFPDPEDLLKRCAQLIPKVPDKTDQASLFNNGVT